MKNADQRDPEAFGTEALVDLALGKVRASVPNPGKRPRKRLRITRTISPAEETDISLAPSWPRERDSGAPGRTAKSSTG
jgi:hypothetical protein